MRVLSATPDQRNATSVVRFGGFQFDLEAHVLSRDGQTVRLQPQPAQVLAVLVRSAGDVVTRDQLRAAVWGERYLEVDQSLNFCIRQIRAALGDEAEAPRFVETIPKRGYRFLAPVESVLPRAVAPRRIGRWFAVAAVLVAVAAAAWRLTSAGPPVATLDGPEAQDAQHARALDPEARVEFLAAGRWLRARTGEGYRRAADGFGKVLGRSPGFLPAAVGRAEALLWSGATDAAREVLDSIRQRWPDEARAATLRGALALFRDWDMPRAGAELRRGVELAPASSIAHHYLSYVQLLEADSAAARASIERALDLDPLSPTLQGDAGLVYYWLGDPVRAGDLCRRAVAADPETRGAGYCVFLAEAALGRADSVTRWALWLARRDSAPDLIQAAITATPGALDRYLDWEIARLRGRPDVGSGTALALARAWILRGHPDSAVAAMVQGLARHSNMLVFAGVDPLLRPVRRDSVFASIAERLQGKRTMLR